MENKRGRAIENRNNAISMSTKKHKNSDSDSEIEIKSEDINSPCYMLEIPAEMHYHIIGEIIKPYIKKGWDNIHNWKQSKIGEETNRILLNLSCTCKYFRNLISSQGGRESIMRSVVGALKAQRPKIQRKCNFQLRMLLNSGFYFISPNNDVIMLKDKEKWDKVIELIDGGALVDIRNMNDKTALIQAVEDNNIDAVKALMDRGAATYCKDNSGHTALEIAKRAAHTDIIKLIYSDNNDNNDNNNNDNETCVTNYSTRDYHYSENNNNNNNSILDFPLNVLLNIINQTIVSHVRDLNDINNVQIVKRNIFWDLFNISLTSKYLYNFIKYNRTLIDKIIDSLITSKISTQ